MPEYITRSTGYQFTENRLYVWGLNTLGQLGTGNVTNRSSPVQTIAGGVNWVQVAGAPGGDAAKGGIKSDGTLWMWGGNESGNLGDNTNVIGRSSPVQTVAGGNNWLQLAVAMTHTAAVKTDGTLWLWGKNNNGTLGNGTNNTATISSPIQTISAGNNWKQVSLGSPIDTQAHAAAVKTDGTLWTWGINSHGQLGDDTRTNRSSPVQTVSGGTNWSQVACGGRYTAAIKTDGTLWLWGGNFNGQLGDNTRVHRSSPVQTISGGTNWKQVSASTEDEDAIDASGSLTAAVKTDGTLWLWGKNNSGGIGDNTQTNRSSPIQTVSGGTNWKEVSVGGDRVGGVLVFSAAAVKTDDTLWTWGNNALGQLGDSTLTHRSSPVQISIGGTTWQSVHVSGDGMGAINGTANTLGYEGLVTKEYMIDVYPSLAAQFKQAGLWVWGTNGQGNLGDNTTANKSSPVQTVAGGMNWIQGSSTSTLSAAIKTDGTLWTWGRNLHGELGDGTLIHRSSPVQTISGGTNWKQVSVGSFNDSDSVGLFFGMTAAIKTDGTLWLWGNNEVGQLGDNTTTHRSSPVQTIAGGTNWKQVSCGRIDGDTNIPVTAAVKTDGTLWTWGFGSDGALGNNNDIDQSSPVQTVSGGNNWRVVSAGQHVAAIKTDGTLWIWGNNEVGQLGDNSRLNRLSPVQTIAGGTNWKYVSTGTSFTASIKTDGTLWTWGSNVGGQLGTGNVTNRSSPVQTISGGANWKLIDVSRSSAAAIKTDGTLWLWGLNAGGQLGDSTRTNRSSPIQTVSGGTNWKSVSISASCLAIRDDSDDPI